MNSVTDFASSLVQMAAAMEREPGYLERINQLQHDLDIARASVTAREIRIIDLKNENDGLRTTIRALEVARDEAQFHSLELEERILAYTSFLGAFRMEADRLAPQVTGPVGEQVVERSGNVIAPFDEQLVHPLDKQGDWSGDPLPTSADAPLSVGEAEGFTPAFANTDGALPTDGAGMQEKVESVIHPTESNGPTEVTSSGQETAGSIGPETSLGQSEADPTSAPIPASSSSATETNLAATSASTAESTSIEGSSDHPFVATTPQDGPSNSVELPAINAESVSSTQTDKPYLGKLYIHVDGIISRKDWLAGGGTEADYEYRRGWDDDNLPTPSIASHYS